MNLKFNNKKITGILTILPENEVKFDDEIDNYNFSRVQSMKLKLIMGYNKRRVVKEGTSSSDLCVYGMNYLFEKNMLVKEYVWVAHPRIVYPNQFQSRITKVYQCYLISSLYQIDYHTLVLKKKLLQGSHSFYSRGAA